MVCDKFTFIHNTSNAFDETKSSEVELKFWFHVVAEKQQWCLKCVRTFPAFDCAFRWPKLNIARIFYCKIGCSSARFQNDIYQGFGS